MSEKGLKYSFKIYYKNYREIMRAKGYSVKSFFFLILIIHSKTPTMESFLIKMHDVKSDNFL